MTKQLNLNESAKSVSSSEGKSSGVVNSSVSVGVTGSKSSVVALKKMLDAPSVQEQFYNALKDRKDAFVSSLIDLYSNDSALQKCEPRSVCLEALKAATMDLPINKALGFAYILPYGTTPTFIVGYKGYIQLAQRTGRYRVLNADLVYEGELVRRNKLTGEITFSNEGRKSDRVVGYFAYFELLNGFAKTLYMTVEEMAQYAKQYSPMLRNVTEERLVESAQSVTRSTGVGWLGNFTSMAIKTVLRRLLSKYGYLSIEMQNAIASESANEIRIAEQNEQANGTVIDVTEVKDLREAESLLEDIPNY